MFCVKLLNSMLYHCTVYAKPRATRFHYGPQIHVLADRSAEVLPCLQLTQEVHDRHAVEELVLAVELVGFMRPWPDAINRGDVPAMTPMQLPLRCWRVPAR